MDMVIKAEYAKRQESVKSGRAGKACHCTFKCKAVTATLMLQGLNCQPASVRKKFILWYNAAQLRD